MADGQPDNAMPSLTLSGDKDIKAPNYHILCIPLSPLLQQSRQSDTWPQSAASSTSESTCNTAVSTRKVRDQRKTGTSSAGVQQGVSSVP